MKETEARTPSFLPAWTLERRWFFQFFVTILICINNGACFCFGIFSPYIKQGAFKYNQSQVNAVSTVGVILSYFSLPTGFLYDTKGPKATLLVGTVLNFVGWLGMFLMFINVDHPLLGTSIFVMCLFYGISQFSASFYETGSVLTNLDAFSCYKGRVILIQKTFMGLGSSVIVQIYIAFFETRFSGIGPFFLFLMIYSLTVGVLGTLFVRLPTESTQCLGLNVPDQDVVQSGGGEPRLFKAPFNVGTVILFMCILYILGMTLFENYYVLSDAGRIIIGVCTIILCLGFIVMVVVTPSYPCNVDGYSTHSPAAAVGSERASESLSTTPPTLPPAPAEAVTLPLEMLTINVTDVTIEIPESINPRMGREIFSRLISSGNTDYSPEGRSARREDGLSDHSPPSPEKEDNVDEIETIDIRERHSAKRCSLDLGNNFTVESEAAQEEIKLNSKGLWYNMRRREMWLMWYVCLASWSSATLVSSNSSQIYEAMDFNGYSSTVNVVFVSIYGVASAMGRVAVGIAHPFLLRRKIPVSVLFCIAPVLNFIGLPLFLGMPSNALVIPFFIVGLATGVSWGSTILIIKDLFAPDNCGKHYSAIYTAGIASPLIFNVALFGPIFDYYSREQGLWETRQCKGRVCIWIPLVACAVVNVIALPLSIYFLIRVSRRGGLY
ncbi:Nodulin-like [Trypanosoma melophagium]|uniref:Nodulin-like n=1 Tax=Trypanosoma melophagium TaxID=715481 RepID=UPI00351A16C3|nr:Nodulin-like [Trypanosoma melophagium]